MFVKLSDVSPARALVVLGSIQIFWLALAEVVPAPYHHIGEKILGAALLGLAYFLRAEKRPNGSSPSGGNGK